MSEQKPIQPVDPTLIGIAVGVAEIRQSLNDFKDEITGNGQPGRLDKLEQEVSDLKKNHWIVTGALVVAGHGIRGLLSKLGII